VVQGTTRSISELTLLTATVSVTSTSAPSLPTVEHC
jgi:hypothetical protein